MIVSARGHYALRVLLDLAEHQTAGYTPMKDVAERQGISLKYLEQIMPALTKANIVEGVHGKGGGYKLCRTPEDCRVGEILQLTEGELLPVGCMKQGAGGCDRPQECRTHPMWIHFRELVENYFNGITLADLLESEQTEHCEL